MRIIELGVSRPQPKNDAGRISELKKWFREEYPQRLLRLQRYHYLGIDAPENRYDIEIEAFNKENELRKLQGLAPLEKSKKTKLI